MRAYKKPYYIPANLHSTDYVFLRRDAVRKPLTPNYTGPHLVISRSPKYFVISGRQNTVSVDRLKTAYIQSDDVIPAPQNSKVPEEPKTQTPATDISLSTQPTRTKSGRHVHWPAKFRTYITY